MAFQRTIEDLRRGARGIAQQIASAAARADKALADAARALEEVRELTPRLGPLIGFGATREIGSKGQVQNAIARAGLGSAMGMPPLSQKRSLADHAQCISRAVETALQQKEAA